MWWLVSKLWGWFEGARDLNMKSGSGLRGAGDKFFFREEPRLMVRYFLHDCGHTGRREQIGVSC